MGGQRHGLEPAQVTDAETGVEPESSEAFRHLDDMPPLAGRDLTDHESGQRVAEPGHEVCELLEQLDPLLPHGVGDEDGAVAADRIEEAPLGEEFSVVATKKVRPRPHGQPDDVELRLVALECRPGPEAGQLLVGQRRGSAIGVEGRGEVDEERPPLLVSAGPIRCRHQRHVALPPSGTPRAAVEPSMVETSSLPTVGFCSVRASRNDDDEARTS